MPGSGKFGWQEMEVEATACTRDRPLGTESLPPGIIHVESDLFPRRLWGKPEEVYNEGMGFIRAKHDMHLVK